MVLLLAAAVIQADTSAAAHPCPLPADGPRELLDSFVEQAGRHDIWTPEGLLEAIRGSSVRRLSSPADSAVCERLNELDAGAYLEQYWDGAGVESDEPYLRYEVGYFEVGPYYVVAVTSTPTPQPEDLGVTRVVTGYVPLVVYNSRLEKIIGWSL